MLDDMYERFLPKERSKAETLFDSLRSKVCHQNEAWTETHINNLSAKCGLCRFPASSRPEIFEAQRTLLEAWSIVGHNFVDQNFGGRNWDEELGTALMAAYDAPSGDSAYGAISELLSLLKDPYTRLIRSK